MLGSRGEEGSVQDLVLYVQRVVPVLYQSSAIGLCLTLWRDSDLFYWHKRDIYVKVAAHCKSQLPVCLNYLCQTVVNLLTRPILFFLMAIQKT